MTRGGHPEAATPSVRAAVVRVSIVMALGTGAVGCTADGEPSGSPPSSSTAPAPSVSSTAFVLTDAIGIEAQLTLTDRGAELRIWNRTAAQLPPPGIYILDARDGRHVDWSVVGATRIGAGASARFSVRRPPTPPAGEIGLIALLLGGEDMGAFVPPWITGVPQDAPTEDSP